MKFDWAFIGIVVFILIGIGFASKARSDEPTPPLTKEEMMKQCKEGDGCVLLTNKVKNAIIETLKQQEAEIERLSKLIGKSCA